MSESDTRGTIKLPRDAYERHNKRRKQADLYWPEYIDGQAPAVDPAGMSAEEVRSIVRDEIRSALSDLQDGRL
jgi:hypothetical protein